jgi:hypothetical protein
MEVNWVSIRLFPDVRLLLMIVVITAITALTPAAEASGFLEQAVTDIGNGIKAITPPPPRPAPTSTPTPAPDHPGEMTPCGQGRVCASPNPTP